MRLLKLIKKNKSEESNELNLKECLREENGFAQLENKQNIQNSKFQCNCNIKQILYSVPETVSNIKFVFSASSEKLGITDVECEITGSSGISKLKFVIHRNLNVSVDSLFTDERYRKKGIARISICIMLKILYCADILGKIFINPLYEPSELYKLIDDYHNNEKYNEDYEILYDLFPTLYKHEKDGYKFKDFDEYDLYKLKIDEQTAAQEWLENFYNSLGLMNSSFPSDDALADKDISEDVKLILDTIREQITNKKFYTKF